MISWGLVFGTHFFSFRFFQLFFIWFIMNFCSVNKFLFNNNTFWFECIWGEMCIVSCDYDYAAFKNEINSCYCCAFGFFSSIGDVVHLNLFMPSFFISLITSILAVENVRRVNEHLIKVLKFFPLFWIFFYILTLAGDIEFAKETKKLQSQSNCIFPSFRLTEFW